MAADESRLAFEVEVEAKEEGAKDKSFLGFFAWMICPGNYHNSDELFSSGQNATGPPLIDSDIHLLPGIELTLFIDWDSIDMSCAQVSRLNSFG